MSSQEAIIFQICQYLDSLKSQDGVSEDHIDLVITLLQSTFNVDNTPENFQSLSFYPIGLDQIVEAGIESLSPATPEENYASVCEDPKFTQFQELVSQKGFYEGAEEGSVTYLQRRAKLISKFKERAAATKTVSKEDEEKEAEEKKSLGNAAITAKEYDDAVRFYTEALEMSSDGPNSHVYYSNRAAAHCYLNQYELAAEDCEASIALKDDYTKAYSRLGLCNFHLGRYEDAVDVYERLSKLEPGNKEVQENLRKAKKKLEKGKVTKSSSAPSATPDLSALAGMMGGGRVPPGMDGLMQNPAMKQAMDKVGGPAGIAELMKDPQMMSMAQQMMKNPAMMQQAMQMMGGGGEGMPDMAALAGMMGGAGGAGSSSSGSSSSSSSSRSNKKQPFKGFED